MGLFSDYIQDYNFANFAASSKENPNPISSPTTTSDGEVYLKRIPRAKLENLYLTDSQTYKTVNSYKHLLLQAGYRITAENKTVQKEYNKFFSNIGTIGLHYKLPQLLDRIIHDGVLFGYSYIERVFDRSGKVFLDLKPIDAKLMDYARDSSGLIVVDSNQNPVGFTMIVGSVRAKTDPVPVGVQMDSNRIFLKRERIACIRLFPFGNGFESLGLIEPAYTQISRKLKIEETASNAIYNSAEDLIYAIVGDTNRNPSTQLVDSTLTTLKSWRTNRRAVFPYPTQLGSLNTEQSPQVQEMLKYLRQEQAIAAGMSLGLAIGTGESNNKSTMNTERRDFNTRLNAIANSIAQQFTSEILDPLYEMNGYGSKAVLKWNDVSVDDRSDMINYIKVLYDMGSITPEEARNYAKNVFDLETDDEAYKEYKIKTEHLPEMPNQTGVNDTDSSKKTKSKNKGLVDKNIAKSKDNYENVRQ